MKEGFELDFSEFNHLFNKGSDLDKYGGVIKAEVNVTQRKVKNMRAEIDVRMNESGTKYKRTYSLPSHFRTNSNFKYRGCLVIDTNEYKDSWLTTAVWITENDSFIEYQLLVHLWADNRIEKVFKGLNVCKEVVGIYLELSILINVYKIENTLIRVFNDANLEQQDLVREFLLAAISNQETGLRGNDFDICYINDRNRQKHKENALFYRLDKLHRKIKKKEITNTAEAWTWIVDKDASKYGNSDSKEFSEFKVINVTDEFIRA